MKIIKKQLIRSVEEVLRPFVLRQIYYYTQRLWMAMRSLNSGVKNYFIHGSETLV